MKRILQQLLLFCLLSLSVKAQDKTYTQTIDSLFINLNKSGVTTGILYDRVFPFAGLDVFNLGASIHPPIHISLRPILSCLTRPTILLE